MFSRPGNGRHLQIQKEPVAGGLMTPIISAGLAWTSDDIGSAL